AVEFALAKREYGILSGREQKSNVIAYQVRQSFKPEEVTPEEANQIGYELAMRFLIPNSNLSQMLGSFLQTIFTSTITNVFSLKQN
ncbi:MAG: relaxase/mobilization nuclease domain-containing protein, partial [Clostridia bacterium]|nr:relaxase/mobilization nuclease domain-containing protein [Clostridia bacterium]